MIFPPLSVATCLSRPCSRHLVGTFGHRGYSKPYCLLTCFFVLAFTTTPCLSNLPLYLYWNSFYVKANRYLSSYRYAKQTWWLATKVRPFSEYFLKVKHEGFMQSKSLIKCLFYLYFSAGIKTENIYTMIKIFLFMIFGAVVALIVKL